MAITINNFTKSGLTKIEVEGAGSSSNYSDELVRAVNFIASIMTSGIEEIPKEGAPLEIKLSYGLRAQAGGGFAISQGIDKG